MKPRIHNLLGSLVVIALSQAANAATFYWDGTSGNWSDPNIWSTDLAGTTDPLAAPLATAGDILNFNTAPGAVFTSTLYLNGNRGDSSTPKLATMNFSATGATTLFGGVAGTPANNNCFITHLTVNALAGAVTIGDIAANPAAKVDLKAGSATFTNNSSSLLTLANGLNSYGTGSTTTFTFTGTGNITAGGVIGNGTGSNVVAITKTGAGTLTLSGVNTNTSATTVSGGTLKVATGGVINNTNATTGVGTVAGGTLEINGGTARFNQTASGNTALQVGNAAASGFGNVTVTNSGVLNVNTGRLILGGSGAGITGTSTFTQDSGTTTVASNLFTANYAATDLNISGGSFTVGGSSVISQRANTNFNISGTANVSFLATVTLGGQAGTYNAVINLNGGTLAVTNIANAANGNTAFNFNGGTLKARQDNGAFLVADTATIGDGGATIDTQNFNVTIGQALTRLSGATTDSLTKTGGGVLTLTGTNTYGGGTIVNGGSVVLSGAIDLPATGTLQVNSGGTFGVADGTAQTTTAPALILASGACLALDWNAGAVDTLASTAAATTSGGIGIIVNPTNTPTGSGLTLLSSPSGGLQTAGSTTYFLANNTNYTATLTQSDTAVSIGGYSSVTPVTTLYWKGGLSGAGGAMAYSTGSASNWTSDAGGTTGVGYVPGSTTDVVFSGTGATQQAGVTLGAGLSVNSLTINDSSAVSIGGGGHRLTLLSTSSTPGSSAITVSSSAADPAISATVVLGAYQSWNVASGRNLTVSGVIEGSNGLSKLDAGNLTLSGANTYTGTTTINSGVLIANTIADTGSSSIGLSALAGALTFGSSNDGTLNFTGTSGTTTRAILFNGLGTFDIPSGSTLTVGATGAASTTSGAWTGSGGVTKTGNGTLTIKDNSAQSGRTTNLVVNNNNGGTFTMEAGTLNLQPQGVAGGSHVIIGDNTTGLFNQTGGTVNFAPSNASVGNYFYVGITNPGTFDITGGTFTADSTQSGGIQVARGTTGTLSIGGGSGTALVDTPLVNFGVSTAGTGTLNLYTNGTLLTSKVSVSSGTNTANFDGGTLKAKSSTATFMSGLTTAEITSNGLTVDTNSFDVTIAQALSGTDGTFTKTGAGTLTLTGGNSYTGASSVNQGCLALVGGGQASPITVANGAFLGFTLGSPLTSTAAVTLASGAKIRVTGTPTLPSYTLMSAASFTGTPVLETAIPGYELVVDGTAIELNATATPFESWVTGPPYNLAGLNAAFDADPESDGLENGLEWVLGGDPTASSASILPVATRNLAGDLVLTFTREEDSIGQATLTVEYDTDLSGGFANSYAIDADGGTDPNGVIVAINQAASPDAVTVTIPAALAVPGGKIFTRLVATQP